MFQLFDLIRSRLTKRTLKIRGFSRGLAAAFLCSVLSLSLPLPSVYAAGDQQLSAVADITGAVLYYANPDGTPGSKVKDGDLLSKDAPLVIEYFYHMTADHIAAIQLDTKYYLGTIPSHLVLNPISGSGEPLYIKGTNEQFGSLFADDTGAYITFKAKDDGTNKPVLSDFDTFENADLYLSCRRADAPDPANENNRYEIDLGYSSATFEIGYAEYEPTIEQAKVEKAGSYDKDSREITWTIDYTPWQNPGADAGVDLNTPFELQDIIDAKHSYQDSSAQIDGTAITEYSSRSEALAANASAYLLKETNSDGTTALIFGGTALKAQKTTAQSPVSPLKITYKTKIKDELLLPKPDQEGAAQTISNEAKLFKLESDVPTDLNINGSSDVTIDKLTWITKEGTTTRDHGNGSYTDWKVTFNPNGFSFDSGNNLTFHDQFPDTSTLEPTSVKLTANGSDIELTGKLTVEDHGFTIAPIETNNHEVIITYRTRVSEDSYNAGEDLGSNEAWFDFTYSGENYGSSPVQKPISSGSGEGGSGTDPLLKENIGYNPATRTITWKVTINPHKANLISGTFIDDLSQVGEPCGVVGHTQGLELVGDADDIQVTVEGITRSSGVNVAYDEDIRHITVSVNDTNLIGQKSITLEYKTKICDPCIFANNTDRKTLMNTIFTHDMVIGQPGNPTLYKKASAQQGIKTTVLTKKKPVYSYADRVMTWEIEVNEAGLPMTDIVLKDVLRDGLTYKDGTLATAPIIPGASASVSGQELTITLGTVSQKTTVSFQTEVNPEKLGFGDAGDVTVANTVSMSGSADGVAFSPVSADASQTFQNHGLVKKANTDHADTDEYIDYEVLINPFGLTLPEPSVIADTLDKRLQLDNSSLLLYEAQLSGNSTGQEKPTYTKTGAGQPLTITDYDPESNCFKAELPIPSDKRNHAFVLCYRADILQLEAGGYSNKVSFQGSGFLLGGSENNSASVGGGGGGGGGVASRKAQIIIEKTDGTTPLPGAEFTLYEWDDAQNKRGLPAGPSQTTDSQGKLTFKVTPSKTYELAETKPPAGYDGSFSCDNLPAGVTVKDGHFLIQAGSGGSKLSLSLENSKNTFTLQINKISSKGNAPLAGAEFSLYTDKDCQNLLQSAVSGRDGAALFRGLQKGTQYWLKETAAPSGYQLNSAVYSIDENSSPLTIVNDPTGSSGGGDSGNGGGSGGNGGGNDSEDGGPSENNGSGDQDSGEESLPASQKALLSTDSASPKPAASALPAADGGNTAPGDPDIPQTEDTTPRLLAIVLLSGVLLAAMTLYWFLWGKKREKK